MSSFQIANGKSERTEDDWGDNATAQGDIDGVEFNIHTFVDVADELLADPMKIDEVEGLVLDALRQATKKNPTLSFILNVTHGENVDIDELVPW